MEIFSDSELTVIPFPGRINFPEHSLSLLVKATFDIRHNSVAELADEQLPATADEYFSDDEEQTGSLYYASDFAYFKPKTDVLLSAKCHVPDGKPVSACPVSLQVGEFKKNLVVYGTRYWQRIHISPKISDPKPFTELDLRYEYSFGGKDYGLNPVGRGAVKSDITVADNVLPVPNIQNPAHPVTSPFDKTAPAGFLPLSTEWQLRKNKMGSYGSGYLKNRWPWFPEDFDWSHFNAAPTDQQIKGYLRGHENLVFENLHAKHARYETRLPGIRPRCFIRRQDLKTGKRFFDEVKLRLDTLWVDLEKEQMILCWRGWAEVIDEDFDEVKQIFLKKESVFESRDSIETCYEKFKQVQEGEAAEFESPKKPAQAGASGDRKIPGVKTTVVGGSVVEEAIAEDATDPQASLSMSDEMKNGVHEILAKAGVDLPDLPPNIQAIIQNKQDELLFKLDDNNESAVIDQQLTEQNEKYNNALAELGLEPENLPPLSASAEKQKFEFLSSLGIDASDAANTTAFDNTWVILAAALPKIGLSTEAVPSLLANVQPRMEQLKQELGLDSTATPENKVTVSQESNNQASEPVTESFAGKDLSGADFSGQNLEGCDFSSAILTDANFAQANLSNANFEFANLSGVNFSGANLLSANLCNADAKAANFSTCICDGLIAKNTMFESIQAEASSWKNAQLTDAVFARSNLKNADFTQATLKQADFFGSELTAGNFSEADLDNATLEACNATGACFVKANITGLRASQRAHFSAANFTQAAGDAPIFMAANFENANLMYGAFPNANFDRANLQGADLSATDLSNSRFIKANMANCKLIKANLMRSTVERANLHQTDIRGSNCYEMEFLGAELDGLQTDQANLTATKLA